MNRLNWPDTGKNRPTATLHSSLQEMDRKNTQPRGVSRAHYLAYKGMAAAAAPERLTNRKNRV